jgi:hypothetical protein
MLTDQQYSHFKTFGFVVLRKVFTKDELALIDKELTHAMAAAYAHDPFDGSKRHWAPMFGESTPFFANLLEDPRLCDVAQQLYGDDAIGMLTDANRYVGDTNWHPDTVSIHQYGMKFAFYLDPVGPDSGALRVIPGSHLLPLHEALDSKIGARESVIEDIPSVVCSSAPGDVVAFDLRLWHASVGGADDRRMCTCVYYNNPRTSEEDEATRKQATNSRKTTAAFHDQDITIYNSHWLSNPSGSPKRKRWIERLHNLEFIRT